LEIKAHSKIGSMDNVKHRPGGGEVKIFDDKGYAKQTAGGPAQPTGGTPTRSQVNRRRNVGQKKRARRPVAVLGRTRYAVAVPVSDTGPTSDRDVNN